MEMTAFQERLPATFEEVWATLREIAVIQKETDQIVKETAAQQKENEQRFKEADRRLKETERIVKENSRQIGGLNSSFGELAEHLVGPGILKRLAEMGLHYGNFAKRRKKLRDADGTLLAEYDIYLENADSIMAIEIKARPDVNRGHVREHIKRLQILREYRNSAGKRNKRIMGAIAGAVFHPGDKDATLKAGLFVMEQSGDTMALDVPEGFVPREW